MKVIHPFIVDNVHEMPIHLDLCKKGIGHIVFVDFLAALVVLEANFLALQHFYCLRHSMQISKLCSPVNGYTIHMFLRHCPFYWIQQPIRKQ